MSDTRRAEVVAIGASAGGVEALTDLVSHLPPTFPAPILVVLHVSPGGKSVLPQILERRGRLRAHTAEHGDELVPGQILVAPGGYHLRTLDGRATLDRLPRENGHRPAVDALFRSVADDFGPRSVAVILSGARDDGTAGLKAIKAAGGWALVQDPDSALYSSMPESAIATVAVDAVLDLKRLAAAITGLATNGSLSTRSDESNMPSSNPGSHDGQVKLSNPGPPTGGPTHIACPDCGGVMTEYTDGGLTRFRCDVGHRYSFESLLDPQLGKIEEALWTAVRALEEHAAMLRRTASMMTSGGRPLAGDAMAEQAADCEHKAALVRAAVTSLGPLVAEEVHAP